VTYLEGILFLLAMSIACLAFIFGFYSFFSLCISGFQFMIRRSFRKGSACFLLSVFVAIGFIGLLILLNSQPAQWPFNPIHIPLYAVYLSFCYYATINIASTLLSDKK